MREIYFAVILCAAIIFLCGCSHVTECELSLCDCKCHPAGQTPEELGGGKCGKNCVGLHNITGCQAVGDRCAEIYSNKSLATGSCGVSSCSA